MPTLTRTRGRLEQAAYDRAERDHHDAPERGFWFDDQAADRVCQFFEAYLVHHKGEWAGQPFTLADWQRFILSETFGWKREDGTRRFRTMYVELPRKNGKSEMAAGIGLYLTVADQEEGAEVYSSATKRDQAKIVHDSATEMVRRSPDLRDRMRTFRNNINVPRTNARFEPLGADSDTLDGLNAHGNIIDELHAHKDRRVWDILKTSMAARRQPLTVAITTAGIYNPESIGWEQHKHAQDVLEGLFEDDTFFAFIAAADDEDDWTSPVTWAKANPNYGISVKEDYMREEAEQAKRSVSYQNTFVRLHLDRWTQQVTRWLDMDDWNTNETPFDPASLMGKACYGGLDLASTTDLSALALLFPDGDLVRVVMRFWCPEETVMARSTRDRVPYDAWVRDKWITATPGNVIDDDFIEAEIRNLSEAFDLKEIGFDPWGSRTLVTHLTDAGLQMVETRQGFGTLSAPAKELEVRVKGRRFRHGGNPVLRWMAANVAIRSDAAANIKPDKEKSTEKIDGIVAAVMALDRLMRHDEEGPSVYETREILTL